MSDTIKQIIDLAVRTRLVDRAAVEDPDGYDGGDVLFRLEEFAGKVAAKFAPVCKSCGARGPSVRIESGSDPQKLRELMNKADALWNARAF